MASGMTGGAKTKRRIEEILELVGLTSQAKDAVRKYSLGMKQRLVIGLALLTDPELILLDEPTNGLDPIGVQEIRQMILRLAEMGRHRHPHPQIICVLSGVGLLSIDNTEQEIRPGEVITLPAHVWHWHGASVHTKMRILSIMRPGPIQWRESLQRCSQRLSPMAGERVSFSSR